MHSVTLKQKAQFPCSKDFIEVVKKHLRLRSHSKLCHLPFISWKFKVLHCMSDPWPAIKMLASEILTKLTNFSYLLFLSCTVITAHWPALPFLCKQRLILLKDRGAWSSYLLYVPLFLKETLPLCILSYTYSWRRQIITFGKLPTVPCAVLSAADAITVGRTSLHKYTFGMHKNIFGFIGIHKNSGLGVANSWSMAVSLVFLWKTLGKL